MAAEHQRLPRGLVVAIANQKGGVGKTTVGLGIASSAAQMGKRVLVIDLDPQANATTSLGVVDPAFTSNDVLHAARPEAAASAVVTTPWDRVDAIAGELALQERDADPKTAAEFALQEAMRGGLDDYDLILIDCPPSVGKLTVNALVAADRVLIVTEPSKIALDGVAQIRVTYDAVRRHLNKRIRIAGIIVNLMPPRGREAQFRLDELTTTLGKEVWEPPVPRREAVREALGSATPIHSFGAAVEPVTRVLDAHTVRLLSLAQPSDTTDEGEVTA